MKEIFLNGWFYSFVIAWCAFFLLVDWYSFKKNVWAGIICSILEVWQDGTAVHIGMYVFKKPGIYLLGSSAFFTFGLAFTMGVLFMQYLPRNNILQLLHIIVFAVGFVIFESLMEEYSFLVEFHWNSAGSIFLNITVMASLAWFKQFLYQTKA